jgi:hypothetical protein
MRQQRVVADDAARWLQQHPRCQRPRPSG